MEEPDFSNDRDPWWFWNKFNLVIHTSFISGPDHCAHCDVELDLEESNRPTEPPAPDDDVEGETAGGSLLPPFIVLWVALLVPGAPTKKKGNDLYQH